MPDPAISLASNDSRRTQREQIEAVLTIARQKNRPLRARIPFTLYDYGQNRSYVFLREGSWNLVLPSATTDIETVERLITALGTCITAIVNLGVPEVLARLRDVTPGLPPADDEDEPEP